MLLYWLFVTENAKISCQVLWQSQWKQTHPKETQALQLSDDILTTDDPVTYVNSGTKDTQMYSMPLMFLHCINIYDSNFCIILDICINY